MNNGQKFIKNKIFDFFRVIRCNDQISCSKEKKNEKINDLNVLIVFGFNGLIALSVNLVAQAAIIFFISSLRLFIELSIWNCSRLFIHSFIQYHIHTYKYIYILCVNCICCTNLLIKCISHRQQTTIVLLMTLLYLAKCNFALIYVNLTGCTLK